jgi:hypothetical protein
VCFIEIAQDSFLPLRVFYSFSLIVWPVFRSGLATGWSECGRCVCHVLALSTMCSFNRSTVSPRVFGQRFNL